MTNQDNPDVRNSLREAPGVYRTGPAPSLALKPAKPARAKLFLNGRSQAVRLPKAFRLPGREVHVYRYGKRVILEPIEADGRDGNGWPLDLWNDLTQLRRQLTEEDFALPPDPPPSPDEFEEPPGWLEEELP